MQSVISELVSAGWHDNPVVFYYFTGNLLAQAEDRRLFNYMKFNSKVEGLA